MYGYFISFNWSDSGTRVFDGVHIETDINVIDKETFNEIIKGFKDGMEKQNKYFINITGFSKIY